MLPKHVVINRGTWILDIDMCAEGQINNQTNIISILPVHEAQIEFYRFSEKYDSS
jgi:hypothetical protein